MSRPNLPLLYLENDHWQVGLYDPRLAPELLGSRFVHGGWIVSAEHRGVALTGRCDADWLDFDGIGWPETFESGLGWSLVQPGEEFLRPGAGRIRRDNDDATEMHALCRPLTTLLEWDVEQAPDRIVMRTRDALKRRFGIRIGYELERRVSIDDDSLISETIFRFEGKGVGQQFLSWYTHPFFPQTRVDGTAFDLGDWQPLPPQPNADGVLGEPGGIQRAGRWHLARSGGRPVFTGCWGRQAAIGIALESGPELRLEGDWPLDHMVLWASDLAASCEPKWARTVQAGEEWRWSLRYRVAQ